MNQIVGLRKCYLLHLYRNKQYCPDQITANFKKDTTILPRPLRTLCIYRCITQVGGFRCQKHTLCIVIVKSCVVTLVIYEALPPVWRPSYMNIASKPSAQRSICPCLLVVQAAIHQTDSACLMWSGNACKNIYIYTYLGGNVQREVILTQMRYSLLLVDLHLSPEPAYIHIWST